MRHIDVERWSRRTSPLHRWDARLKLLASLLLIAAVGAVPNQRLGALGAYAGILVLGLAISALPIFAVLTRAALVLPFAFLFSLLTAIAGDTTRAIALPVKTYLSCLAALLLIGTTTLPAIVRALHAFHLPRALLFVTQIIYRYLFVLFEHASAMKRAAACRGGSLTGKRPMMQAAAGTLAVLFGKSHDRAEGIHNAMLSRGFTGNIAVLHAPPLNVTQIAAFLCAAALIALPWILL